MQRLWAQPLRRQLLIAILLLLVPVLGAAFWSGWETLRERRDEVGEQARIVAMTTAAYVNRDITNFDRLVQSVTADPGVIALDARRATDVFARVMQVRPAVLSLVLTDPAGKTVAGGTGPADTDHTQEWAVDAARKRSRLVVPLRAADSAALESIVIAYPVVDGSNAAVGVVGVFISPQNLHDVFKVLPLPADSVVTVADFTGRILSRSVADDRYVGRYMEGEPRRPGGILPPAVRSGVDGTSRINGEALVEAGPWIVNVGVPVSTALARAAALWTRSFTILGLGLAGWLIVALVLSRRLTRAVAHLDEAAQRIAAGDFTPIVRKQMLSRELEDFQEAFDQMLHRFNATREALDEHLTEERRIRQELESLQGQIIRQERLAAVGQLVSGVAHEINNPLQAILGFAELLQIQGDIPPSARHDLTVIQKESARACAIIRNLALFARQQPGEATRVRLTDVIASVAELRQRRLESEDIELRIEDRSAQPVMAVLTELQQVVLNFVVNAEQAILGSGRLPGRITVRTFDEHDRVVLEVEDTGPGVAPEHEISLFEPFFTTKPVGQGTGLGLSVSYGIIDSLGGRIGYRRAAAGGSVFYFNLPAAAPLK